LVKPLSDINPPLQAFYILSAAVVLGVPVVEQNYRYLVEQTEAIC